MAVGKNPTEQISFGTVTIQESHGWRAATISKNIPFDEFAAGEQLHVKVEKQPDGSRRLIMEPADNE